MLQSKKDLTLYQEIIDNQEFARSEIGRLEQYKRSIKMNYILIALSVALAIALFYVKYLVSENTILKENEKVIIEAYENSIEQIEKKAKFEKEVIIQKEPVVKASERVKVETKKRGEINENNTNSDFVIVSF
mgnify:CR=1 FL=1